MLPHENIHNNQDNKSQNSGSSADGNAETGVSKVQTGDENNVLFYGAMLIASVFGLVKNRDRKEKKKL